MDIISVVWEDSHLKFVATQSLFKMLVVFCKLDRVVCNKAESLQGGDMYHSKYFVTLLGKSCAMR